MPAPTSVRQFLKLARHSGLFDEQALDEYLQSLRQVGGLPEEPGRLAERMQGDGLLTPFQARQLLAGRGDSFILGKYCILDRLGRGSMGAVYLCEHVLKKRRAAVKVLTGSLAAHPTALQRFQREATAATTLDHPNIVRAFDVGRSGKTHFLVMEYVDGADLEQVVRRDGPLEPKRAARCIRQAAEGLHHAFLAGLVHRDIKPSNLLLDRLGIVKIMDLGLALFFENKSDDLTRKHGDGFLGTTDFLAPEQAVDSHAVDIRADIYSLGATFYFLLTGRVPFAEGTVTQKLLAHQLHEPPPVTNFRDDVPAGLLAVLGRMMAKDPAHRYQAPREVAEALAPWAGSPRTLPSLPRPGWSVLDIARRHRLVLVLAACAVVATLFWNLWPGAPGR